MTSLTAWKLDSVDGARKMAGLLEGLQKANILQIEDAAIVEWPDGAKKPKLDQLAHTGWAGAAMGGFWGFLFGLIFLVPVFGMAIGAAMGAIMGHFSDYGIDDEFIKAVQQQVTPGTSALFLLATSESSQRVLEEVHKAGLRPQLIESNLSSEQETKLREAFAEK